jgi:outer membrane protein assembly factor BamE (lipoprotein component of BamABCDE complex)
MKHVTSTSCGLLVAAIILISLTSCNRSGPHLTGANYDLIALGMSKAQVEKILGPPTTMETKDMLIFKKTTYRYEEGKKFVMITFKNDEVDGKESNMSRALN